jgi:hypothetical protein
LKAEIHDMRSVITTNTVPVVTITDNGRTWSYGLYLIENNKFQSEN